MYVVVVSASLVVGVVSLHLMPRLYFVLYPFEQLYAGVWAKETPAGHGGCCIGVLTAAKDSFCKI